MTLQTASALDLTTTAGTGLALDTLEVSAPTDADLHEQRAARWTQRRWEEWTVD